MRANSIGAAMAMAMPAVSPRVLIAVGALRVTWRVSRLMPVMVVPAVKAAPVMVEPTMMFSTPSRVTVETPCGARAMLPELLKATKETGLVPPKVTEPAPEESMVALDL